MYVNITQFVEYLTTTRKWKYQKRKVELNVIMIGLSYNVALN